jgi:hypothetical protein
VYEKRSNQNAQFSLKRNGMESVLGLNSAIENLLDALHKETDDQSFKFQVSSLLCLRDEASVCECEHSA